MRGPENIASASTVTCWTRGSPHFEDPPEMQRLRLAACLLADVAWQANPGFRADRAEEMALHGNWVAIDPAGRVVLAQALASTSAASG